MYKSVAFAFFLVSCVAVAQTPQRRIIDVHMHCYADDPRFGTRYTNPLTGYEMVAVANAAEHTDATFAAMQRLGIIKAVVSGDDYATTLRWKERAPEKIVVGYDASDPAKTDLTLLRREHAAGRLQVIGEVAPQYLGIAPNDPRLEPIFALAEELDAPVAFHVHPGPPGAPYMGLPKMRAALGDLLLEEVLVRHPKLRLYVMHAGWPFVDRMKALLYAHPQVYVDVAAINWSQPRREFHRFLRELVEPGYGKRIMFGSDQMVWPQLIEQGLAAIEEADFLTTEQKDDIFYRNAERFFRLTPQSQKKAAR